MNDFTAGLEAAKKNDYALAYSIWLPLAKSGNPYAQFYIAYFYLKGFHVKKSSEEVEFWLEKARKSDEKTINEMITLFEKEQDIETYFELNKGFG